MNHLVAVLLVFALMSPGRMTMAQNDAATGDGGTAPPGAAGGRTYSQSQLEQMVAPIALYPDSLVSQILIASTYPIEIVEAYQWMQKNKALTGAKAQEAAKAKGWDPSVQSLVQFPQIVERMYSGLEWTQDLGEAFLAQQQDVLGTIQAMRQKAYAAGNLKTTEKQKVVVQENTIVIVPAQPQVVYVPAYNPTVVYGSAWAPASWYYPPVVYAPPPGYVAAAGVIAFGAGVAVGAAWSSSSNCSWSTGNVTVNNNYYRRSAATPYNAQNGSYRGASGSVAHAGNTTAAYNANTGQVKSYNSATGETRSGQVNQGARGTTVQGQNASAAHAGNTTATYNKNTGQVNSYNSATGNTRSGNTNNAGASNWQHNSAERQGQPYSNSSLNKQYGGANQNSAAARGYGEGGGGGGRSESAASSRGQASRSAAASAGGGGFGGGGSRGGGGGGGVSRGGGGGGGRGGGGRRR